MTHPYLTAVQSANLYQLHAIRLGLEKDTACTCRQFALDRAVAEQLRKLTPTQVLAFVANIGSTTLFPMRTDLLNLLAVPVPLAGSLAAVRQPKARPPNAA